MTLLVLIRRWDSPAGQITRQKHIVMWVKYSKCKSQSSFISLSLWSSSWLQAPWYLSRQIFHRQCLPLSVATHSLGVRPTHTMLLIRAAAVRAVKARFWVWMALLSALEVILEVAWGYPHTIADSTPLSHLPDALVSTVPEASVSILRFAQVVGWRKD